jgi:DNA-directed RNA polymerase II subunit RPB1
MSFSPEVKELYEILKQKPIPCDEKSKLLLKSNSQFEDVRIYASSMNTFALLGQKNIDVTTGFEIRHRVEEPEFLKKNELQKQIQRNHRASIEKTSMMIEKTSFYCLSSQEIINKSVLEITFASILPGISEYPTLFDSRLGCIEATQICTTCQRDIHGCSGHYGRIRLNRSFIHPFFKQAMLYSLRCTCHYCGHLFLTPELLEVSGLNKIKGIKGLQQRAELSDKIHQLHSCPDINPKYDKDFKNGYIIVYSKLVSGRNILMQQSIENVEVILSLLTLEEIRMLGFEEKSNPINFITKYLLVVPPQIRPTFYIKGLERYDYLTQIYLDIIAKNKELKNREIQEHDRMKIEAFLYTNIEALMIGSDKKILSKGTKNLDLQSRLKGKEGLLRKNMMGKRVNFSSRTVAGPASEANFGEILIPRVFTENLTIPVKVTYYNQEECQELLRSGVVKGIISVEKSHDQIILLTPEFQNEYVLKLKDTIIRPIQDGDALLFGRQPTLHAESFMGGTVKLHDHLTIGLHSSLNAPLNADFDGDELNCHIIQTPEAMIEALTIANCKFHIMNSQSNRPMMGLAYNGLLAGYLMTVYWTQWDSQKIEVSHSQWNKVESAWKARGISLNQNITNLQWIDLLEDLLGERHEYREIIISENRWEQASNCVRNSKIKETLEERCLKYGVHPRSSRALFSLTLPRTLNYAVKKNYLKNIFLIGEREETRSISVSNNIIIREGILVSGTVNKDVIGTGGESLVAVLNKLYSFKESCRFVNDAQKIADWFILYHNFSIGYKAIESNRPEILKILHDKVSETQFDIYNLGPIPRDTVDSFFWYRKAIMILENTEQIGKTIGQKALTSNNPLNIMGEHGSKMKGSDMNTAQITGSLGEQFIERTLPQLEFNDRSNTLPTFLPNDCSIDSMGYIIHSFYDGLQPSEVFFHLSASREGVANTGVKTSELGYLHRRLVKSFEDITINFLGQVAANNSGIIISFNFGDYMNPAQQLFTSNKRQGKKVNFCNVSTFAEMLNNEYEQESIKDAVSISQNEDANLSDNDLNHDQEDETLNGYLEANGQED